MKKKKIRSTIIGGILLFLSLSIAFTISIVTYDYINKIIDNNFLISLIMFIVLLILSLTYTIIDIVRRKLTIDHPLNKILTATDQIAHGNFKVNLEINHSPNKYDDFDYIMENINKMTNELAQTEIVHNDFISNISHELKTPLTIIQSYALALQNEHLSKEDKEKYLQILQQTSKKLSTLITNVLKLNKLENQKLKLEKEKLNFTDIVSTCILQFEELLDKKNIHVECHLEDVEIVSIKDYLEIICNNLISNAIKFSYDNGSIRISLTEGINKIILTISDDGCGIPKEIGNHIFDKFYQGDTSHFKEGNGLGLALVKKVIDIIGGSIIVDSEINKGSTFKIELNKM